MNRKIRKLLTNPRLFFHDMVDKRVRRRPRAAAQLDELARRITLRPKARGRFRYSVISAVYEVENYLEDYFASLVYQTLDFEEHIELVLVDDGSTDGSEDVIRKWQAKYPRNIRYLRKENGGQGSARNAGIPLATGDWITFIDPDDFVDHAYFEQVDRMLSREDAGNVGLLCCNFIFYQENQNRFRDDHPLRFRFSKGNLIVSESDLHRHIQLAVNCAFFRRDLIVENNTRFDERIRPCFEDAHFVGHYLLRTPGVEVAFSRDAKYYYRRRSDGTSTLDGAWAHRTRYGDVLELGCLELFETAQRERGHIPRWLQRTVLYECAWHFRWLVNNPGKVSFLTEGELDRYKELLRRIFALIDDSTILNFELAGSWFYHKVGMLGLFKQTSPSFQHVYVEDHDPRKRLVQLRYFFHGEAPLESFCLDDVEVTPAFAKTRRHSFLDETFVRERIVWIPYADVSQRLSARVGAERTKIVAKRAHRDELPVREAVARLEPKKPKKRSLSPVVHVERLLARSPVVRRRFARAWLFMDRDTQADDNAEHLYRYVRKSHPEVNAFFLLRQTSPDWSRLEREGFRLLAFGSFEHRLALLNADHLVSSHADNYVVGYLQKRWYGDLLRHRTTFLQHGITIHDLSRWLNSKAIDLFVTSTSAEADSIRADDTGYKFGAREVLLSGFPRHDPLLSGRSTEKLLLIMPTWRQALVGGLVGAGNSRALNPTFYTSEYARRWKSVLHSPRLRELAIRHGYRVVFFPHANVQPYLQWFDVPSHVEPLLHHGSDSMQTLFRRAAGVVTDYSSVAFEMAYLRKPCVYYQFDQATVFSGAHTFQKGYFEYERDGFGPVVLEECDLLDEIGALLERGCTPIPEYLERMERTFAFRDGRCCERVFEAIAALNRPDIRDAQTEELLVEGARRATELEDWPLAERRWARVCELPSDHRPSEAFEMLARVARLARGRDVDVEGAYIEAAHAADFVGEDGVR